MSEHSLIIHIHPEAPAKPALGATCNGCGVCCLIEPCPLGMVLTGQRRGACQVLQWQPQWQRYQCGAIMTPDLILQQRLPAVLLWLAPGLHWVLRRWARRWVAAGVGCDCAANVSATEKPG
ncbi:MAG: hypothetical protein KBF66_04960 [Rhodoferax sp.]|uniref:hypothetical protein n=1 Tax=Rhodoferax sp. TaxID=50421 RepID=UPI001B4AAC7F|nr:hypothetical protein [Rhodoferax sp.]MBP9904885.1 hypothetical protein [Rhodoferax sp.]